ncbi:MAG: Rrf2 family transcriptional regulator [Planctomycetes bacterium]|nr:Rrf2 family transcriptional regulator [Planctomycetota bacterium]
MKLSLQTDYSLRTLMFLAMKPDRQTVSGIASFFQISEAHVGKVVHRLSKLGYVRSIRGIGGGLELVVPPEEISIGEIIRAIEGVTHLLECVGLENVCVIQQHCKLRGVLDHAEQIQFEYLDSVHLSDVLPFARNDEPRQSRKKSQSFPNKPIRISKNELKKKRPSPTPVTNDT